MCLEGACLVCGSRGISVSGVGICLGRGGGRDNGDSISGLLTKDLILISKGLRRIRDPAGPKRFSDGTCCNYREVCCIVGGKGVGGRSRDRSMCKRFLVSVRRGFTNVLRGAYKVRTKTFRTVILKSGAGLSPRLGVHCRVTKVVRVLTVSKLRVDLLKVKLCGLLGGVNLNV